MVEKNKILLGELVEAGSEIIGGSVSASAGVLIGSVIAGTPGAVVGGAVGAAISKLYAKIGIELKERVLSHNQEKRIGAVFIYALKKIESKLEKGLTIRDELFVENNGNRSEAEEMLEGILLTSQQEYEEMKIKYYGELLANIPFDSTINRAEANYIIRLAERLSYRQYCLLHIYSNPNIFPLVKTEKGGIIYGITSAHGKVSSSLSFSVPLKDFKTDLAMEIDDLVKEHIVERDKSYTGERYDGFKFTKFGKKLYSLLGLNELDDNNFCNELTNTLLYKEIPMDKTS